MSDSCAPDASTKSRAVEKASAEICSSSDAPTDSLLPRFHPTPGPSTVVRASKLIRCT
ncbi:MAG: hypothetical protein AB1938_06355 [Myxococcota bacterium]